MSIDHLIMNYYQNDKSKGTLIDMFFDHLRKGYPEEIKIFSLFITSFIYGIILSFSILSMSINDILSFLFAVMYGIGFFLFGVLALFPAKDIYFSKDTEFSDVGYLKLFLLVTAFILQILFLPALLAYLYALDKYYIRQEFMVKYNLSEEEYYLIKQDEKGKEPWVDGYIILNSSGIKVKICCYQTARLGETYCKCGLAITDAILAEFE